MMKIQWFTSPDRLYGQVMAVFCLLGSFVLSAQEPVRQPGSKGYIHPGQHMVRQAQVIAENMEPVIVNKDQEQRTQDKLKALEKKAKKKPNIVIFLLDDVGWMDVGFNGGGIAVGNPTPNIDRVASQGLILTSAYSQPSCSPTRATIMTGQYPVHHGILSPPMYGQPGGLEGLITVAKLLSDQGYVTQAVGKWHMGENEGSQPQNVGFDDFRGFLSVSDMYTEWRDYHFNPEIALGPDRYAYIQQVPFNKHDVHAVKGGKLENVQEIDLVTIRNLDQEWAAYGEKFIRRMAKSDKPFFMYYGTRGCHFDNYPNDYYLGRSVTRTSYSDCIVEIDDIFGRLYTALEESGQLDNTLIFFTSDNGPEAEIPPHGRTPFRGSKGSTWEGGVRVPTFAYWKGMIQPRKSEGLFDMADLFNTSMALAGKNGAALSKMVPSDRYIDGIDQTSFLLTDHGVSNRRSILYFLNEDISAVRIDEFKYMTLVDIEEAVNRKGDIGGFSGTIQKTSGAVTYNLYTNPKEDASVGIRHIPAAMSLMQEMERYKGVLKKFPPKKQIGLD